MDMGTGGIPTTDNVPETTEIFGCPTDNIPETTDFLKHLILSYSFEIKKIRLYLKYGIPSLRNGNFRLDKST